MDAIALHQYGFDCAVASLGTSLTQEHADLLSKYTNEVVLTYDGDAAGQNATQRAIPMLERTGLRVKILRMRGAKDPDEFFEKIRSRPLPGCCFRSAKIRPNTGCARCKCSMTSRSTSRRLNSRRRRRNSFPVIQRPSSGKSMRRGRRKWPG